MCQAAVSYQQQNATSSANTFPFTQLSPQLVIVQQSMNTSE